MEEIPGFVMNDGVPEIVSGVLLDGAGPRALGPPPPT
jgi:hypothetical protein